MPPRCGTASQWSWSACSPRGPVSVNASGASSPAWRTKVAEFQARGLVHFHVIVRLDGAKDRATAPGVAVSPEELCDAIREAAARTSLTGDAGDGETVELRFGEQLDTRVLAGDRDGDRELCPEQVAGYVAKYSCKASHEQITTRDTEPDRWRGRGVPEQLVRMAYGVLRLSERTGLRGLAGWVHMLGFRGHFVTKSRGYSTNLGTLRGDRAAYRAQQDESD
jgi:replication initiator protein RepSA